jgi:hypothetical protein
MRANLCLLQEAKIVPIKGRLENGVRPHINFLEVRYSSDVLSNSPGLIGKNLRIYFDVRDIRSVKAFLEDGSELGILRAARPWCYTPHSVRVRQEIMRLKRLGKLKYREGDDPVEAWAKLKRSEAKTNKRAATALAKAKKDREALKNETGSLSERQHVVARPEPPELPAPAQSLLVDGGLAAEAIQPRPGDASHSEPAQPEPASPPQPRVLKLKRTLTF